MRDKDFKNYLWSNGVMAMLSVQKQKEEEKRAREREGRVGLSHTCR